jgi:hypothetical protein
MKRKVLMNLIPVGAIDFLKNSNKDANLNAYAIIKSLSMKRFSE